jgi:DNA-binding MarR family transcriptional regulator
MTDDDLDASQVADALLVGIRLLVRRIRQMQVDADELTLPETSALSRLDRGGPATASALARLEQISPQSMGATLAKLESRGLLERHPDPDDGRRVVLTVSDTGRQVLGNRRTARAQRLADALAASFTQPELHQLLEVAPLIERLGQAF